MDLIVISWILIILASISQVAGGILDMHRTKRVCYTMFDQNYCVSKSHLWSDSIFLLVLAIAINIISRT